MKAAQTASELLKRWRGYRRAFRTTFKTNPWDTFHMHLETEHLLQVGVILTSSDTSGTLPRPDLAGETDFLASECSSSAPAAIAVPLSASLGRREALWRAASQPHSLSAVSLGLSLAHPESVTTQAVPREAAHSSPRYSSAEAFCSACWTRAFWLLG